MAHVELFHAATIRASAFIYWDPKPVGLPDLNGCESQKQACRNTHVIRHAHAREKYTQMVAQKTICFCWLAPWPLIKHGVAETFIPGNPISKQSSALNNTDMNLSISLLFHHSRALRLGHVESGPPGLATAHRMFTYLLIEF